MTAAPFLYVVDASVAVQLVVPEALSARATQLFALLHGGRAVFHVPDLFDIESANVFWKKVGRGVCSPAQATQALADLLALPLQATPTFAIWRPTACAWP